MKCAIVFGVLLALVLAAGVATGDVLVVADFEDQDSLDYYDGGTDLGALTDTPGGDSVYSTAFRLQPGMESYEVSLSVGTTHDPGLDISGYTYVNFYMKATGMLPEEGAWFGIIGADRQWVMGAGFGEAAGSPAFPEITTEWQYFSMAIDELDPGLRDTPDLTNVWRFRWSFDVAYITAYIDHITVSDTPDEGRLFAEAPPGPEVYVDADNTSDIKDGTSWEQAFTTIQTGINKVGSGDEVWVAEGTYTGSVNLKEGVSVYGGFAGSETERSQRDWTEHETIIDGEGVRRCVMGASNITFDGFIIVNGDAGDGIYHGGGMFCDQLDAVTISNCTFRNNSAFMGGALCLMQSSVTITNCIFSSNLAYFSSNVPESGFGGAIALDTWYRPTTVSISDCTFVNNQARDGGAVSVRLNHDGVASTTEIVGCTFSGNQSTTLGGAVSNQNAELLISGCVFSGNLADIGGAISNLNTDSSIRNSTFWQNWADGRGGAIHDDRSTPTVANCTFWGNSAGSSGGAIYNYRSSSTLTNCILWDSAPDVIFSGANSDHTVTYSNLEEPLDGDGNISENPELMNALLGDFRLRDTSPCIDAGVTIESVTTDIRGVPRPAGTGYDIGAYEFTFVDGDGDGMDDGWEVEHDLNPADPADGNEDPDGDGFTNLEEYELATNPRDISDPPTDFYVVPDGDDDAGLGTLLSPWQTIARAMAAAEIYTAAGTPSVYVPITVHLAEGVYEEMVEFVPHVTLAGAGAGATKIQCFCDAVVTAAEDTHIRDCTISLPGLHGEVMVLVRIEDVVMEVADCVLDGGDNPNSIGMLISGVNSSASVIRDSEIRRLQHGIWAVDSGVNITENVFEGIHGDAVFVRLPEGKRKAGGETPLLGDAAAAGTGFNEFRSVMGNFITNMNPVEVRAESNDWGLHSASEIAAKMFGQVDFEPYIGMPPPVPGDVNGTGKVDAQDVQLVINEALGIDTQGSCDLDGNGSVNAVDVQLVINTVLGVP